jgi:hypothetical protein
MTDPLAANIDRVEALLAVACAELERFPPSAWLAEVRQLAIRIPSGDPSQWRAPHEVFADADALADHVRRGTREGRLVALPILAGLDVKRAAEVFEQAIAIDLSGVPALSYAGAVVQSIWARWTELQALISPRALLELWARGRFRFEALTEAQILSATPEEYAGWLAGSACSLSAMEVDRLAHLLPGLDTLEGALRFLDRAVPDAPRSSGQRAAVQYFSEVFASRGYREAMPLLRRVLDPADTSSALYVMGDEVSLRPIADGLEGVFASSKIAWDPHHPDVPVLKAPIHAVMCLDRERAFERFAPRPSSATRQR